MDLSAEADLTCQNGTQDTENKSQDRDVLNVIEQNGDAWIAYEKQEWPAENSQSYVSLMYLTPLIKQAASLILLAGAHISPSVWPHLGKEIAVQFGMEVA